MSARLEAAVKAWDHHWGDRYGDEALEEMGEEVQVALAAADAVMFSDEAIERAAEELWDGTDPDVQWDHISEYLKERTRIRARAVVAALKGEQ